MSKKFTSLLLVLLVGIAGFCGCSPLKTSEKNLASELQSEDPAVRISALKQAADSDNTQVLGLVIDRLCDTEADVRFFAGLALKKIAGADTFKQMGWFFYDSPANREKAVQRWRNWLKQKQSDFKTHGDAMLRISN